MIETSQTPPVASGGKRKTIDRAEGGGRTKGAKARTRAVGRLLAGERSLEARIGKIAVAIPGRICFSSSLGLEDQAILHAIAATGAPVDVFTLDTGRHFPETLQTLHESELRYGLKIRLVAPDALELEDLVARDGVMGFRFSIENRKACCEIRKVRPLRRALVGAAGWITGLRREQSTQRASVPLAEWDEEHGLIKLSPIADWSSSQLESYLAANNVPISPLHAKGFASIGCQPCTRAIRPGEDPRAGRWWWENEDGKECGLHTKGTKESGA